jgi:hypothetical protein
MSPSDATYSLGKEWACQKEQELSMRGLAATAPLNSLERAKSLKL